MKGATIQGCNFQNAHTSSATTKLLVLSPLDRPEEWAEEKVREQAENVKPYTISIGKEESGLLTLCLEETPLGKVLFSVALDEAKYVRHRKAWHSVRLPDDRRFGLVLVEDAHFTLFSEALSAALDGGAEDQDSIDGPGENCTVKAQAVAVKGPSETRLRRLNLDLGPAATDRATSLSSPPSTMSLSSAAAYGPEPPQLRGGVGELIRRFQTAVSTGNSQEAQAVAKQLTQYRANLDLHVNVSSPTEKEIAVRIHVEDQHSSGGCIVLNLRPSTKISQLKSKILLMYGFAPETQKWIIGKKMAHDEDTLAKCGVQTNNTPVFLYLLAHKTIGMTKEDFQKRYGHLRGPGHRSPPPPTVTTITRQHRPRAAPTPLPAAQTAPVSFQQTIAEVAPIQPITADQTPEPQLSPEGWPCTQCTFLNLWTRHACNICSADRPEHLTPPPNYVIPRSERERLQQEEEEERRARELALGGMTSDAERAQHYRSLVEADQQDLIPNDTAFTCPVCMDDIDQGAGIMLRECLHTCCRDCLRDLIKYNEMPEVTCPYRDDDVTCRSQLQHREIKALVSDAVFQRFLQHSVSLVEHRTPNSYHCKTPDCLGFCFYEDRVNSWMCPVCEEVNCLTCKAIHTAQTCRQYQAHLELTSATDETARRTKAVIEGLLDSGEAMRCPSCQVVIQKKAGCDWVQCSMCFTEICWVTRGPRWGPEGEGDESGGCHCLEDGVTRCAPDCVNCH